MAYFLESLVETLEKTLHPDQHHQNWVLDHSQRPQIQSLLENASFLKDLLADHSPSLNPATIDSLEDRIEDMAENAENILELHITDQIISMGSNQTFTISLPDLQESIRVFESAKDELIKIMESSNVNTGKEFPAVSSRSYPNPKNLVVGLTQDLNQLKVRLTSHTSKLEIIPIVGMGGIGKTTLARILYDEYSSAKFHFDACAWVTVSQDYNQREILLTLLECVTGHLTEDILKQKNEELIVTLYKSLFGRRYLVILDDVWSSKVWDGICKCFPDDSQRSRIIFTTRDNNLANYVKSKSHEMRLLNQFDSWDLLREKIYGNKESCPPEMGKVGKRIANKCRGLPLAVQVIGGLLLQARRSKEFWEQVADNINSFMTNENEQLSNIFSLSYDYLPRYLKPCILYMGAFPEDCEIRASTLVNLWIAEGFLKPVRNKSLEETAEAYLDALTERNLIFVRTKRCNGKPKSYGVHDLLRELCLKKAEEKKFLCASNFSNNANGFRRVIVSSIHDSGDFPHSVELARSLICLCSVERMKLSPAFAASLLRVLDVFEIHFYAFPKEILKLVNLRYLALFCQCGLPETISTLTNLRILIARVGNVTCFSLGIFDLPQLRYISLSGTVQVDPFQADSSVALHENLLCLSTVPLLTLKRLLGKIPNLRKLGIYGEASTDVVDLTCFHKLEAIKCFIDLSPISHPFLSNLVFPDSLKSMTLCECTVPQTFMSTVGLLPYLEILKLRVCILESSSWEPYEGGYESLQYLQLKRLNLVNWIADETHFPVLRHLAIQHCPVLNDIPLELGGIETLEVIELDESNTRVLDSARRIVEGQLEFGNNLLQLRICK